MSVLSLSLFSLLFIEVFPAADKKFETNFHFLVEGEKLQFTSHSKKDRVTLIIQIPLDATLGKTLIDDYDSFITTWTLFPAFADTANPTVKKYLALSSASVENILKINDLIPRVLHFKDKNSERSAESACAYSHNKLEIESILLKQANIKNTFAQLSTDWTLSTILANPVQDLALRTAMLALAEATEELADSLSEVLSTMDTLSSNVFPEAARGHYHSAPCIGILNEESIIIVDCFGSKNGFICDLEISTPLVITEGVEYFPVHYENIRLRGDTADQKFIKLAGHSNYQVLNCDHYRFNREDIPACSTFDLKEQCDKALRANNIAESIKNCKFTREVPHPVIQANKGSFLIQGKDIAISQLINTEYTPIPSSSTPLVVFSPSTLKISQRDQEWIMSSIAKVTALKIYKSSLTQDDVKNLESKYYMQTLLDDMDGEDYVRNLLLVMQAILYPIALVGLTLGIKARKQLIKKTMATNHKQNHYKSNKVAMKSLLTK